MAGVAGDPALLDRVLRVGPTQEGNYRHWDIVRHLRTPDGLSAEQWWFGMKLARSQLSRALPLIDAAGTPFSISLTDQAHEMLHHIDQRGSGQIAIDEAVLNPETRRRYVVSSLIEEAITSSQLEGANTTRRVAKEMLRSGRPPRSKGEQMVLNNYRAMNFVREVQKDPLTPSIVFQVHELVTQGTLDEGEVAGALQTESEGRVAVYDTEDNLLHQPPPADQLPERIDAMCRFANGEGFEGFLHPVVRAILLHFWLAYDHPFVDGNGRTARVLFYWSMLSQGYWLTEFLSISRILKDAPARYGRSFLYTETDGNDVTYFVMYQLDVICRALADLHEYLARKMSEVRATESLIRRAATYNHRQIALISHALRHPDASYTFKSHANSHNVVWQSGRSDLLDLERRGVLERRKVGRSYVFSPPRDLAERLRSGAA
jgi:Fic family protein